MSVVYLEENKPKRSQFRTVRRDTVTGAIVIHTAESTADLKLPDDGAEGVAKFIQGRSNPGSYHTLSDSDSWLQLGKYEWEMFGEGTGGNKFALHHSFACEHDQWRRYPNWWVDATIHNGVLAVRHMANWVETHTGIVIPGRWISLEEYWDGRPGFISHGDVDPERRKDPGDTFPRDDFLARYNSTSIKTPTEAPDKNARLSQRMWNLEALTMIEWGYRYHQRQTVDRQQLRADLNDATLNGIQAVMDRIQNG